MATENTTSFDDLEPVETPNGNDDDVPIRKLEAGEAIVVEVRHIERNAGKFQNSLVHLTDDAGERVL